ncbi:unnamed protein product [Alopecurus aequalis]
MLRILNEFQNLQGAKSTNNPLYNEGGQSSQIITWKFRAKLKSLKLRRGEQKKAKQMAETPSKIESARKWVVDHKLRAVGCLWLTGISSSIAYNWSRPHMKTSVKIIHASVGLQFVFFCFVYVWQHTCALPAPHEIRN